MSRGPLPSLSPAGALLGAGLLSSAILLFSAAESRAAVWSHKAWVTLWVGGGGALLLLSLRSVAGAIPGTGPISAPLWLAAGIAGAAALGGKAIALLAASGIEAALDAESVVPLFSQGELLLLGVLAVPLILVWLMKLDRGGVPPLGLLGLAGLGVVGTVVVTVLLNSGMRPLGPQSVDPTESRVLSILPMSWVLVAYATDCARSRVLRAPGMIGIVLGSAVGFVLLPYVTFAARPTVLRRLGDEGLFELITRNDLGKYGSEIACGMEAGLLGVAAAAVLIVCLRNAVYSWRWLPGVVALAMPVAAVLFQSSAPTSVLVKASLVLGWAAVVVGTPFTGRVGGQ